MLLPSSPAVLSVILAAYFIAGVSFARDERRAEQVLGDDDPITLPTSVVPEASNRIWQLPRDLATGSVSTPLAERGCMQVAWFPDRAPEDQFRPKC
jgi:hypothetical protein